MDTQELTLLLVVIVVLVVVVFAFGYLSLRRLKERRARLSSEVENSPALKADRAYNQARLARTEAEILERSGVDVGRARRLVDEADASIGRRDYDGGLSQARAAHELLVRLRSREKPLPTSTTPQAVRSEAAALPAGPSLGAAGPSWDTAPRPEPVDLLSAPQPEEPLAPSPSARLPKNRAESRFQLTMLDEELSRSPAEVPVRGEVEALSAEAHGAYDRGDYGAALSGALRARRRLGSRLETLPPTTSSRPSAGETPSAAGVAPCPRCGRPTKGSDQFCRSCGAPTKPPVCPRCGRPVEGDDAFCGSCGAPTA